MRRRLRIPIWYAWIALGALALAWSVLGVLRAG